MSLIERKNKYSWDDKVTVATLFQQLGNSRLVSEKTGVPYQTILDWRKTDWWVDLMDELKSIKRTKTGQKLSEIIELGVDTIKDRLENGDVILNNKTGEIQRKPVSLRDAAQAVNNLITRQIQMEELAEKLIHRKESAQETLKFLAKEFAKFNREQSRANAQTIDYKEIVENGTGIVQPVDNSPAGAGEETIIGGGSSSELVEENGSGESERGDSDVVGFTVSTI